MIPLGGGGYTRFLWFSFQKFTHVRTPRLRCFMFEKSLQHMQYWICVVIYERKDDELRFNEGKKKIECVCVCVSSSTRIATRVIETKSERALNALPNEWYISTIHTHYIFNMCIYNYKHPHFVPMPPPPLPHSSLIVAYFFP